MWNGYLKRKQYEHTLTDVIATDAGKKCCVVVFVLGIYNKEFLVTALVHNIYIAILSIERDFNVTQSFFILDL